MQVSTHWKSIFTEFNMYSNQKKGNCVIFSLYRLKSINSKFWLERTERNVFFCVIKSWVIPYLREFFSVLTSWLVNGAVNDEYWFVTFWSFCSEQRIQWIALSCLSSSSILLIRKSVQHLRLSGFDVESIWCPECVKLKCRYTFQCYS